MTAIENERDLLPRVRATTGGTFLRTLYASGGAETSAAARESDRYHGANKVREALHLDEEGRDFKGKNVFIIGNMPGRFNFDQELTDRGANVTVRNIDTIANPMTSLRPSSPEIKKKDGHYDSVVAYMALAFYGRGKVTRSSLDGVLKSLIKVTNFDGGGELKIISFDFSTVEEFAKENPGGPVAELWSIMSEFFELSELNPTQGKTMKGSTMKAAGNKYDVDESIYEREDGRQYWPELRDLCLMLAGQCDAAIAGMSKIPSLFRGIGGFNAKIEKYKKMKARFLAFVSKIDEIMKKPESERPAGRPPVIKTITVRKKQKK